LKTRIANSRIAQGENQSSAHPNCHKIWYLTPKEGYSESSSISRLVSATEPKAKLRFIRYLNINMNRNKVVLLREEENTKRVTLRLNTVSVL